MLKKIILDEFPIMDDRGVIFYSYGYQKFSDYIFAFPYYFPTALAKNIELPRLFYKKIENERRKKFFYLRSHGIISGLKTAETLGYNIVLDERYGIPTTKLNKKNITKIFNPFGDKGIMLALRKKISDFFKIPFSNIGVTRSYLIGLNAPSSNVDITIKGMNNFKKIINNFPDFLKENGFKNISRERIKRHVGLLPKKINGLKSRIKNKFWPSFVYGKKNIDFHFVKSEKEAVFSMILKQIGKGKIIAKIVDSEESFFAPYKFLIKIISPKKYSRRKAFLIMYSRFFSGIFKNNEKISFIGRLREIKIGKRKYLETNFESGQSIKSV